MNIDNLMLETEFEGGERIRLRELDSKNDWRIICQTVRKNAEDATLDLYKNYVKDYPRNKRQIEEKMTKYGLENILKAFKKLDAFCGAARREMPGLKQLLEPIIKQEEMYSDAELFCPYGSFQTSAQYPCFAETVQQYLEKIKEERLEKPRKSFHLGIMHINRKISESPMFLGCLVFTVTQKQIGQYKTEGSINIFASNRHATHWRSLHPAVCFWDYVMGFKERGDGLYLRGTTHPCNDAAIGLLENPHFGFIKIGIDAEYVPEFYGPRYNYVVPYSNVRTKVSNIKPVPLVTTVSNNNDIRRYAWDRVGKTWTYTCG
jgi:hypothetical protein